MKRRRAVLPSDSEESDEDVVDDDAGDEDDDDEDDDVPLAQLKRRRGSGADGGPAEPLLSTAEHVASAAATLRDAGSGAAALRRLLQQLDVFPMTLGILRASDVAKAVKALRSHSDGTVSSAAAALFGRWKSDMRAAAAAAATAAAAEAPCQPTLSPAATLRARLSKRAPAAAQRTAAQLAVHAELVAKAFRGRPNFTGLTKAHVSRAFALIDKGLLDGQLAPLLKEERRTISFRVAPRMTARAGQLLTVHAKPRQHELAISSTLLMQTFSGAAATARKITVNGCPCADRTEALLRVMEHEMIHLLFACEGMPASCRKQPYHGPAFCSAVQKLFGHSDYRHDLITPREVAAVQSGVESGCTVRFTLYGETLTGKYTRIPTHDFQGHFVTYCLWWQVRSTALRSAQRSS